MKQFSPLSHKMQGALVLLYIVQIVTLWSLHQRTWKMLTNIESYKFITVLCTQEYDILNSCEVDLLRRMDYCVTYVVILRLACYFSKEWLHASVNTLKSGRYQLRHCVPGKNKILKDFFSLWNFCFLIYPRSISKGSFLVKYHIILHSVFLLNSKFLNLKSCHFDGKCKT